MYLLSAANNALFVFAHAWFPLVHQHAQLARLRFQLAASVRNWSAMLFEVRDQGFQLTFSICLFACVCSDLPGQRKQRKACRAERDDNDGAQGPGP